MGTISLFFRVVEDDKKGVMKDFNQKGNNKGKLNQRTNKQNI